MTTMFQLELELNNIHIAKVEKNNKQIHFYLETIESHCSCRYCKKITNNFHGKDREIILRHQVLLNKITFLHYQPHRYYCEGCKITTTATPDWHKQNSSYTLDYEKQILLSLINSTIVDVSMKEGLTEEQVQGTVDRYFTGEIDWRTICYLGVLGIDEIALKKGHKNYVTLITSRHEGSIRILAVIEGRKKAAIKRFLKTIPRKLKKTVEGICVDMNEGYINAVKEVFKKITIIVIDRFHVAKLYRGTLDKYRQKILKELKSELPASEYVKLKNAMNILRRDNECASKKEKETVDLLFSHSEELAQAYGFALKLTQLFNTHMSREDALIKIRDWIKEVKSSKISCFNSFIKTLKKHKQYIVNYFIARNNSGFVEGLNNKAKVLKRRCYGIFNIKHLFQRLHLDISGYRVLLNESTG